jgi:hypothetical protein
VLTSSLAPGGVDELRPPTVNGTVALAVTERAHETAGMRIRRFGPARVPRSAFAGSRFPPDVIVLAVRWYLRFGLSYRDVEELLGERGVEIDHVTVYRWVQRFTRLFAEAARPCRHAVGGSSREPHGMGGRPRSRIVASIQPPCIRMVTLSGCASQDLYRMALVAAR